ncbi:Transposase DDE domain-containing protein [Brevibacterium aurantiacum]|uniref:Transposase DDE domain-containing protein n=1 Tax=Brevibacterium aurantiacum TaxID=273384 RepID=A0A2H1KZE1_BREAU|nr:Transposase DDE domain-containing protein [Brevibacterium aurantiacum]
MYKALRSSVPEVVRFSVHDAARLHTTSFHACYRMPLPYTNERDYRAQIAEKCFAHSVATTGISLLLYDVTTLYFEAEKEDDLRQVGYSKERRVDPQIVVGLLVDRTGFPLEIGCFEGAKAETHTIIPVIKTFQDRHQVADMVVAADAGMLSAKNLKELDDAGLRFIVGSRQTKAPHDLATHFRWNGEYTEDGQIIDTITPKGVKRLDPDRVKKRREPVWSAEEHPDAWRVVWQYRRKRAMRDEQTLNLQRNRALAIIDGDKPAKKAQQSGECFNRVRSCLRGLAEEVAAGPQPSGWALRGGRMVSIGDIGMLLRTHSVAGDDVAGGEDVESGADDAYIDGGADEGRGRGVFDGFDLDMPVAGDFRLLPAHVLPGLVGQADEVVGFVVSEPVMPGPGLAADRGSVVKGNGGTMSGDMTCRALRLIACEVVRFGVHEVKRLHTTSLHKSCRFPTLSAVGN